jgi:hypothetical protein
MQSDVLCSGFAVFLSVATIGQAAELSPATVDAWNHYLSTVEACAEQREDPGKTFLWIDEAPDRSAHLRKGEILVGPGNPHTPQRVASGLIHHWIAATFIPDVGVDRVIASLREYDSYSEVYRPAVVESKRLAESGDEDRFSLLLMNKGGMAKIAVDAEFASTFSRTGDRACGIARATHLRDIEDYGQRGQRTLPDDQGPGYIWRFYSIYRMQERDGGVYLEMEVIALSRDVPASIEWLVAPMIRRVAKGALSTMLEDTRSAVVNPPARVALRRQNAAAIKLQSGFKQEVK